MAGDAASACARGLPAAPGAPRARDARPAAALTRPSTPTTTSGRAFGGDWATRPAAELAAVMDAAGVEAIVDLDGGLGRRGCGPRSSAGRRRCPGGSRCSRASTTRAGPTTRRSARRRRRGCATAWRPAPAGSRSGSCSGSGPATRAGALVPVDDPRLDPLWAAAGELGVPVTIHVADPIAFFEPARRAQRALGGAARPPRLALLADAARRAARPRRLPAVRRADRRARGGRRAPSGDDVHRRARRLRGGGPRARVDDPRALPELPRRHRGADRASSAASRTRRASSSSAGRTGCCSGPTWRPTRRWWAVYYRFLEIGRRIVPLRRRSRRAAEPGPLADPRPRPARRRRCARVYRDNALRADPVLRRGRHAQNRCRTSL